jgi:putative transposase
MTPTERQAMVTERKRRGYPWHGPPHLSAPQGFRIVTGVCYEHRKLLDNPRRLGWFERELLASLRELTAGLAAWCVLPNHYHALVFIEDIEAFSKGLGQLHGRTSHEMNTIDGTRGRRVWYRSQDRTMRSDRHYFTSLNYIHNNPVKHGYVTKWQDWPFSSVHWYLENKGREWMLDLWRGYPVLKYGDGWDEY